VQSSFPADLPPKRISKNNSSAGASLHVAILMDGNGRWAASRGLIRPAGYRAGAEAARRILRTAPTLGIGTLTLYAFSADNWNRPSAEISAVLAVVEEFLREEAERCRAHGIRIRAIGRRDRLPEPLAAAVSRAEHTTSAGRSMDFRIALDYSSRDSILRAACHMLTSQEISHREFSRLLGVVTHGGTPAPDVDILIRTGGECRLSDFLLWECAYAELFFVEQMWPDFQAVDLEAALREFHSRERRFGKIPAPAAAAAS
jgi:undecaprenyl diphosphate synthase